MGIDYEAHVERGGAVPDVILVRKSYDEKRRRRRDRRGGAATARVWKLKQLDMAAEEGGRRNAEAQMEEDRERFMQVRARASRRPPRLFFVFFLRGGGGHWAGDGNNKTRGGR